jgi:phosphate uptake regulator
MPLGGKHTMPGFDQSLEDLRADILMMAALVRRSLSNTKRGFLERDEDACSAVIADDEVLSANEGACARPVDAATE